MAMLRWAYRPDESWFLNAICIKCLKWQVYFIRNALRGQVVSLLLESGGSPEFRDRVSMESAFDVARTDEVQKLLVRDLIWKSLISRIYICTYIHTSESERG
jgi:hypothetical protein